MKAYYELLESIEKASLENNPKSELLSPLPLAHSQELAAKLPLRKNYLGPSPWYDLVNHLNPISLPPGTKHHR